MSRFQFVLLMLPILAWSAPAQAQVAYNVVQVTAPGNQSSEIDRRASWGTDCSTGQIATEMVAAPKHGAMEFRREPNLIGPSPTDPRDEASFGDCLGRQIQMTKIIYTPEDGFLGIDSFTYRVTYDSGQTEEFITIVTVDKSKG